MVAGYATSYFKNAKSCDFNILRQKVLNIRFVKTKNVESQRNLTSS